MKSLALFWLCFFYTAWCSAQAPERTGLLILAHGGSSTWQNTVHNAVRPLESRYPVEVAFGMADPSTIQQGLDALEKKSVANVVVVPLFISTYSPIIRQTEFLLGLRKDLADEPMMDHDHSQPASSNHDNHNMTHHSNSVSTHREAADLQPLTTTLKIVMTKPLDDHPLVAEILYDRIMELSRQPENETIVLVAHGPNDESDNQRWVQTMESLSDQMRTLCAHQDGKRFKNIFCLTVRDDADTLIHEQAKEHLRGVVRQAAKDGRVLVIPLFLSHGGVERKVVTRLEGLTYEWNGKTLLPHNNITKFIELSITGAAKNR